METESGAVSTAVRAQSPGPRASGEKEQRGLGL